MSDSEASGTGADRPDRADPGSRDGAPPTPVPVAGPIAVPSLDDAVAPAAVPADAPTPAPVPARRARHRVLLGAAVVAVAVVVAVAGLVADQRIDRPLPQPAVAAGRLPDPVVPGTAPTLPWPPTGQGAVAVPALGYTGQSGPEQPVPIASLTKMTTAVVVLRDHPLAPGATGPGITVTPDEAAQFGVDLDNDETSIPLQAGETLTELQLLEALMNQSANDAAYTLAEWDAGSQAAFVAKMNALAASLGAVDSHYVDASGFDPASVSTASDTLRIAAAGMAIPTFASVAGMPTVNLPGVGVVHNIVTEIGTDGVVGVKSGFTTQASGCMVLAGFRTIGGRSVLVLASTLGQLEPAPAPAAAPAAGAPASPTTTTQPYSALEAEYPLRYAGPLTERLLDATEAAVVPVPLVASGHPVGTAGTEWGGDRHVVPVVAARGAWLFGVPGQRVTASIDPEAATGTRGGAGAATAAGPAGSLRYTLGSQTETVPVRLAHRLADPGWWWKVLHN